MDNVLVKFKYLWHAGLKAKLSVESHAGQAWVVLQAGLGHAPRPPVPWPHQRRNRNGPAQQWRRARCEAAQKVAAESISRIKLKLLKKCPKSVIILIKRMEVK